MRTSPICMFGVGIRGKIVVGSFIEVAAVARLFGTYDGDVHPHPGIEAEISRSSSSCRATGKQLARAGDFSSEEAKMCEQPIPFWSE